MIRPKDGLLLYHLTKLSNWESIIKNGLVSRREVKKNNYQFEDIADSEIIDKRLHLGLDNYIPFHFHTKSAFDYAVKRRYPNDCFIYICIKRDFARMNGFKILPKHPLSTDEVTLFDFENGIDMIDWDAMEIEPWECGFEDYNRQVRMAECLTDKKIPINCFHEIAVENNQIKETVETMLRDITGSKPYVNVRPWLKKG